MIPIKLYNFFFSVHSINRPNINQNNEIENINKEIGLLQDRVEINEKSLNQFKNMLMQIRRIQGQSPNLSKAEKIYLKISKDIFDNKIKRIKKKADLLKNVLVNVR